VNGTSSMLSNDQPMHARASKMISTEKNHHLKYEGNAVLWQGANRLQGDFVEIDRDKSTLSAHGRVVSQLVDKAKDDSEDKDAKPATKPATPVFTIVKAPELVYDDNQRLAHYKGGAALTRPNMQVKAQEIRAFLRDDSDDSSLDHAFADGKVEVVQTAPQRTRNGASEHVEYFVDDERVILEGGSPKFTDSIRGTTKGTKLTWFSKDDRLLVNGVVKEPAKSVLRRKNAPQ
jgi:lipopolysaccharide export system protein LptA